MIILYYILYYTYDYKGNLCKGLRSLDLQYCSHITDDSIHSLAKNISCLTSLKLDGNHKITTRALIMHIGIESYIFAMFINVCII